MGAGEILLILVIVLIIFGPAKIPEIARNLGKTMNTLRKTSSELTTQIRQELEEEEKKASPPSKAGSGDRSAKPLGASGSAGETEEPRTGTGKTTTTR